MEISELVEEKSLIGVLWFADGALRLAGSHRSHLLAPAGAGWMPLAAAHRVAEDRRVSVNA